MVRAVICRTLLEQPVDLWIMHHEPIFILLINAFLFTYAAFRYTACDADPRHGPVLMSPFVEFQNNTLVRINVSFPFNELNQNRVKLIIYRSNSVGIVDKYLATVQPPVSRSYEITGNETNDEYFIYDFCAPAGSYNMLFIASWPDNVTVDSSADVTPSIVISSIETRNGSSSCLGENKTDDIGKVELLPLYNVLSFLCVHLSIVINHVVRQIHIQRQDQLRVS